MLHDSMHLSAAMLEAAAQGKAPMRSPLAQQNNFGFGEDFLAAQVGPPSKQGEQTAYDKPHTAYGHLAHPDGNLVDFRVKNTDTDFSRQFNQFPANSDQKSINSTVADNLKENNRDLVPVQR